MKARSDHPHISFLAFACTRQMRLDKVDRKPFQIVTSESGENIQSYFLSLVRPLEVWIIFLKSIFKFVQP